ncbi:MAG TPA: MBL fold metallo-hydrolase, partial [Actinomycetota bacterium]|nr:MBL fold metallo-hydrolase [Actinomycetota bacterium]
PAGSAPTPAPLRLDPDPVPGARGGGRMTTELTWIGQAGFLLRTPATRLAVDPFLSDHPGRRFRSPVGVGDLAGTELVLTTHQHLDHLDAPGLRALLELDDRVLVVVPAPAVPDAAEAGLPPGRLVGARPGEPITAGDVTVYPVPALHGVHVTDAYSHGLPGDGDGVRYLGYVLDTPDGRVYHAGDTLRWDGQAELLRRHRVDLALLPINGRDAEREARDIVGNLDAAEALALARDAAVGTVAPMHYDLMAGNLGDADAFLRLAPERYPGGRMVLPERMAETPLAALLGR